MAVSSSQLATYGWRIPFLLGGVFGLLSVYLRRLLSETPVFEELRRRRQLASETPLKAILSDHRGAILLSGILTWMLSAAIVVVILMTPALLEKVYHVQAAVALQANSLATASLTAGCVVAGWLTDRFGPGRVLLVGCPLLGLATCLLYSAGSVDPLLLTILYSLAGFSTGTLAVVPYIMIRGFPAPVRFSGVSFSYNLAYAIFGGMTPIIVTWLLRFDHLAPAYYVSALCVAGLVIGLVVDGVGMKRRDDDMAIGETAG
jgi:MFS family permease